MNNSTNCAKVRCMFKQKGANFSLPSTVLQHHLPTTFKNATLYWCVTMKQKTDRQAHIHNLPFAAKPGYF